MGKVYLGDTPQITLETGIDLSTATSLQIMAIRPDGSRTTWLGVPVGTAIEYNVKPTDLNQRGTWKFHAKVTNPAGNWTGEMAEIVVFNPGE